MSILYGSIHEYVSAHVCMRVYIYMCVYIYIHTHVCIHIYIYIDGRVCVYIMYKSTSRSGCPMVPVSEANENPGLTIQESVRSGPKFRGFQMVWYVWIHHIYIIICIACMCIYIYTMHIIVHFAYASVCKRSRAEPWRNLKKSRRAYSQMRSARNPRNGPLLLVGYNML